MKMRKLSLHFLGIQGHKSVDFLSGYCNKKAEQQEVGTTAPISPCVPIMLCLYRPNTVERQCQTQQVTTENRETVCDVWKRFGLSRREDGEKVTDRQEAA